MCTCIEKNTTEELTDCFDCNIDTYLKDNVKCLCCDEQKEKGFVCDECGCELCNKCTVTGKYCEKILCQRCKFFGYEKNSFFWALGVSPKLDFGEWCEWYYTWHANLGYPFLEDDANATLRF